MGGAIGDGNEEEKGRDETDWVSPSEVFTTTTRSKGVALSMCVNWLFNFIVAVAVPPMLEKRGYKTYIFFTVMCFLAVDRAVLSVPKSKGKCLEEMDDVFKDGLGQDEQAIMHQARFSVGQQRYM